MTTPSRSGAWLARKVRATFPGHSGGALSVAISPDAKTLASVGYKKIVKLWDMPAARQTRK